MFFLLCGSPFQGYEGDGGTAASQGVGLVGALFGDVVVVGGDELVLWWCLDLLLLVSLYLVDLYYVGVDGLEAISKLGLIYLDSHSTVVPSTFN
ncbi:hypothetical protein L195_g000354 [Trifolium pratense]|uniref:Uncharacterized protein n=1 Tax=Trifolium pratense TaxID=57577 RepID=A0A2K3NLM9_TRIPR|nr:hypothetical protein L195_g000354 [Trifolium pratense]